jgi:hypothetical protein
VLLAVLVPLLSLGIGFWVAFVRPRDPLAWLLLVLLTNFAVFYNADAEQWGPVVRDIVVIYRFGVEAALPIAVVLFGIYFPEPFPRQGRWVWWYRLMWLLIVPSALLGAVAVVDNVVTVENRAAVMGLDRVLVALGFATPNVLFLACCLFVLLCAGGEVETGGERPVVVRLRRCSRTPPRSHRVPRAVRRHERRQQKTVKSHVLGNIPGLGPRDGSATDRGNREPTPSRATSPGGSTYLRTL